LWTQFGKINLRNIRGFADFFEFNIHACRRFDSVNLLFNPCSLKRFQVLAALIIGALTAYFLGWDVPIMEKFHLNSKFTDWNPIQHYTTRSIHLNSRICRRAGWVVLTPY
jgi:hypothetical protein